MSNSTPPEGFLEYLLYHWQENAGRDSSEEERQQAAAVVANLQQALNDNPVSGYDLAAGGLRMQNGILLHLQQNGEYFEDTPSINIIQKPQPAHVLRRQMSPGFSRDIGNPDE